MPTEISAPLHFRTLLNAHTYLIADFYATWCPPCKTIAPMYEQLSKAHTTAEKLAFVKINVDEQREIAAQYGIQAMPTFLAFKDGKVIETIKGTNLPALKQVVKNAVEDIKTSVPAPALAQEKKVEEKVVENVEGKEEASREAKDEKTVSGSYGMTGGSNWKTSLR